MRHSNWLGVGVAALMLANGAFAQDAEIPAIAPAPKTAAEMELERLKVEQGIAEAEKAIRDAEATTIPSSGVAGKVETGDGAGEAEVMALGARQFSLGAARIIRANPDPGDKPLYIATGVTLPDVSAYQIFVLRQDALVARLDEAGTAAAGITGVVAASPGAVVAIGSAVLSYFRSDFSLAKVTVAGLDDAAMAAAVTALGAGKVRLLDQGRISDTALRDIKNRLDSLEVRRQRLELARQTCVTRPADLEKELAVASTRNKPAVRRKIAVSADNCATVKAAVDAYAAFVTDYTAGSGAELTKVFKQAELNLRMTDSDVLLVKVHGVVGGRYTQQNIVSHLGGMPFHVTTTSVVSWQRVAPDGAVIATGWEPLYDGYRRIGDIDTLINGCSTERARRRPASCTAPEPVTFAAALPRIAAAVSVASQDADGAGGAR